MAVATSGPEAQKLHTSPLSVAAPVSNILLSLKHLLQVFMNEILVKNLILQLKFNQHAK